jgi:hypothetical protein
MGLSVSCPDCVRSLLIAAPIETFAAMPVPGPRQKRLLASLGLLCSSPFQRWHAFPWLARMLLMGMFAVWLICVANYSLFGTHTRSRIDCARAQLRVIESAIGQYQANNGVPLQRLEDLLRPDPFAGGVPYFADIRALTDPWGNLYLYEIIDPQRPTLGFKTPNGQLFTNWDGPGFWGPSRRFR